MLKRIITGLAALFAIAAITGCGTSTDGYASDPGATFDDTPAQTIPTQAQVDAIKLGSTEAQVRAALGEPRDTQSSRSDGEVDDWLYYGDVATTDYQFAFENGRLRAINKD